MSARSSLPTTRTRSLEAVKADLSSVIDSVQQTHERVTVTRKGIPAVVSIAVEDLASLKETLAVLQERDTLDQSRQAEREVAAGEPIGAPELTELITRKH